MQIQGLLQRGLASIYRTNTVSPHISFKFLDQTTRGFFTSPARLSHQEKDEEPCDCNMICDLYKTSREARQAFKDPYCVEARREKRALESERISYERTKETAKG